MQVSHAGGNLTSAIHQLQNSPLIRSQSKEAAAVRWRGPQLERDPGPSARRPVGYRRPGELEYPSPSVREAMPRIQVQVGTP